MNVAFIPVRGGSKSIPLKNIKMMAGHPLVYWTAKAACECKYIDRVYISTDSSEIRNAVDSFTQEDTVFSKIELIDRSTESASDTASTEYVMLEFAEKVDFDNIVLVQATSPLLCFEDLNRGFEEFQKPDADSVMSVVHQYRFNWQYEENGLIHPTNYDVFHRPRRQEFSGYLVENGAFYITSRNRLLSTKNRVSGNIRAVEMPEDTFFEIDEPSDWVMIENLLQRRLAKRHTDFSNIKLFFTDVDGCLTDGGMYYSENGDELKKFNTRDGKAFQLLREQGIKTGIVTSESVELNVRRAQKLKLDYVEIGCKNKLEKVQSIANEMGISMSEVAYVGDDINDVDVIKIVGFGCCPSDAVVEVKNVAKYITKTRGGEGVIREVVENCFQNACT